MKEQQRERIKELIIKKVVQVVSYEGIVLIWWKLISTNVILTKSLVGVRYD